MRCVAGVTFLLLSVSYPVSALDDARNLAGRVLNVTFDDRRTVQVALRVALAKLQRPTCAAVYREVLLPEGRSAQSELERRGIDAAALLKSLVFAGGRIAGCGDRRAAFLTTPGSLLIRVCPGFSRVSARVAAILIIHESLHALGVGENPPTSADLTAHVERRCW